MLDSRGCEWLAGPKMIYRVGRNGELDERKKYILAYFLLYESQKN